MWKFIKLIVAWFAAFWVALAAFGLSLLVVLVVIAAAFEPEVPEVEPNSLLVIDLAMSITDTPSQQTPKQIIDEALAGEEVTRVALREVLTALDLAADDANINGVLLYGNLLGGGYGNSLPALKEVRAALDRFEATGKPVYAYLDLDGAGDYYLKSAANHLIMAPDSYLEFKGLAYEDLFWADTFARYGVGIEVFRAGEFKSLGETLTRSGLSEANREQTAALLNDLWAEIRGGVAEARDLAPEQLDRIANAQPILTSEQALGQNLADELLYRDELVSRLEGVASYDPVNHTFTQIALLDYLDIREPSRQPGADVESLFSSPAQIAVVYAEGAIYEGESDLGVIGADTLVRDLKSVREDKQVKAVVLRVNSPGGSVTASDKIVRELQLIAADKPLIVSMGGYAASGGYLISMPGDRIFAEESTVTGSIGVIAIIPNFAGVAEDHAVGVDGVRTHQLANLYTITRPRTPAEAQLIQGQIDGIYDHFVGRVAANRDMDVAAVRDLAGGRVWSGEAARQRGLVDEIGGLETAIQYAADRAGLGNNYQVRDVPAYQSLEQWLEEALAESAQAVAPLAPVTRPPRQAPWAAQLGRMEEQFQLLWSLNDPRGYYYLAPLQVTP